MLKNGKKLIAVFLTAAIAGSMISMSLMKASATVNPDGSYAPTVGVRTNTYYFAMPGAWMNDYWETNENCAGFYWWSGADTPDRVLEYGWPGYRVNATDDEVISNLYSSAVPADANQIVINNHVNGGYPGTDGFVQKQFDSAYQTDDINVSYYSFMESKYYSKDLWKYVWDKAAEEADCDPIEWSDDNTRLTSDEKEQISEVYMILEDEEIKLDIEEFGQYSKNFYVETENGDGIVLGFDNMIYVVNLDPASMKLSTSVVPEGKTVYGGDWFFYYGNGEYGTWPTKELLIEKNRYFL